MKRKMQALFQIFYCFRLIIPQRALSSDKICRRQRRDSPPTPAFRLKSSPDAYRSSRLTGQDIQRGPPRPRESSADGMVMTSMPFLSKQLVGYIVAVVGDDRARRDAEGVRAVVPLLALRSQQIAAAAADQVDRRQLELQRQNILASSSLQWHRTSARRARRA